MVPLSVIVSDLLPRFKVMIVFSLKYFD